ncbi:hypothetical protein BDN70DRAFT_533975 [Pholiota conissans]|uniref:C3H1-type domain-containing protein n=1 Tax=Pholiota conissans TaxID=109636 RepID=A0A9P6D7F1_9AGAR|nr:hypothetical protein BDN70DRAFT_533975 [Pholiota conissans]
MDQGSTSQSSVDVAARRAERTENASKRAQEAEKLKLQGNELFKKGDFVGAADLYAQAVNIHGPKPVLMANMAAAYLKLELYDEAEWACTTSLECDPTSMKSRFRRALARRKLHRFESAKRDLQDIVAQDPNNESAKAELKSVEEHMRNNNGTPEGPFDKYPLHDDTPWELLSDSETEDSKHIGNRMPCRFYNKGECRRGTECKFSHAPDAKSIRDELGRNVCVHSLLGDCAFGTQCVYSHSQTHLPVGGWWNDSNQVQAAKEVSAQVEKWSDYPRLHELLFKNPMARTYASLPEGKAVRNHFIRQLEAAKVKLQQRKPREKPFVLVLSFDHDSVQLNILQHLFSNLEKNAKVVYLRIQSWASQALEYLDSPLLTSVLITDPGITKKLYARVVQKLVEYTKSGGRVVIAGLFSGSIGPLDFNKFIKASWDLDWTFGSYFRSTFSINPTNQLVHANPSLHKSYGMKAVHIANIEPEMAVYKQADAPAKEAPAVCASVGRGLLCFLGDVNAEEQSTNTVLAMLGVLDTLPTPRKIQALDTPPKITDKLMLILELEGDDHYKRVFANQLAELEKRITVKFLYESDFREAIALMESDALYGVYVADEGIQNVQNMGVLQSLKKYALGGGRVVFGGLFGQNTDPEAFSFMFSLIGLPWKYGSTGTCEAQLNQQHEIATRYPTLNESFHMDAVHVKGFAPGDDLYKKSLNPEEKRQQGNTLQHAPIIQSRLGRGRIGYIGGVGAPPEILLALLDFSIPVPQQELVPDSTKFLIMLAGQDVIASIPDVMKDMKERVDVILGLSDSGLSNARIIDLLPSQDLVGVLVMDASLLLPENAYLLSKAVEYSKNGGTVVFASTFGSSVAPVKFKPFFQNNWGLKWEMKLIFDEEIFSLTRNFESPLFQGKKAKDIKLPKSVRLKGVQIQGIEKPMAVYFPSAKELWNPETNVYAASILFAEVADGHLGYLGTTQMDGEARNIIYAMFGLI